MTKRKGFVRSVADRYKNIDWYGYDFKMNMRGQTAIPSYCGATVTLISIIIIAIYTYIRYDALASMRDTKRSSILVTDWIDETYHFNFQENGF